MTAALTAGDFDYVRNLVRERSAIVLEPTKAYLVETRLAPLLRVHGLASIAELVGRLRSSPSGGLHRQVVDAMTTNETSFYRDGHPFECLRRVLLPEMTAAAATTRRLSIWSAACSSGQEPYAVAMLLKEHFPELGGWSVRIIATDLSEAVLARAQAGVYSQVEISRGLPTPLLAKYFTNSGPTWQITPDVRRMVEFRQLNLAQSWAVQGFNPGSVDVLLLRNVLIYFDLATKRSVLEQARRVLSPKGVLFLGGAETTLGIDDRFERCTADRATYYRQR